MTEQRAQQWKLDDRVEWEASAECSFPGTVLAAQGGSVLVELDGGETLSVKAAHLRRFGEGRAA